MSIRFLIAFALLLIVGCGDSQSTAPTAGELSSYVDDNAEMIAEQERVDAMEDTE